MLVNRLVGNRYHGFGLNKLPILKNDLISNRRSHRFDLVHRNFTLESESQIRDQLRFVQEPLSQQPLLTVCGIYQITVDDEYGHVFVKLNIDSIGYPLSSDLIRKCERSIHLLPWVQFANVDLTYAISTRKPQLEMTGLSKVQHVLAVSSCKGGVGKSTVAVNLALSLVKKGLKVGILDADIYGPSVPTMLRTNSNIVRRSPNNDKFVLPLDGPLGLKMLSFGHVNPKSGAIGSGGKTAALLRGPVASRVINQLAVMTDWGELDYLIVDMPPGTGDIQITLCQTVSFDGAVVVTTPHNLSLIDAIKGLEMFSEMQVPTLAVAENMSYFEGDDGKVYYPFGIGGKGKIMQYLTKSDKSRMKETVNETPYHSFPISKIISDEVIDDDVVTSEETMIPAILRAPQSDVSDEYLRLADSVISQLYMLRINARLTPVMKYDDKRGIILRYFTAQGAAEYHIPSKELRFRSPLSGKRVHGYDDIDFASSTVPTRFEMKGNYGMAIHWSDGHFADIFPFTILRQIAEEVSIQKP